MPKSVTVVFGVLLAAAAIGWNTWRFPIVWQMVQPTPKAGATVPPPSSSQKTEEQARPEKNALPAVTAINATPKPVSEATPKVIPEPIAAPKSEPKAEPNVESNGKTADPAAKVADNLPADYSAKNTATSGGVAQGYRPILPSGQARPKASNPLVEYLPPVDPNITPPTVDLRGSGIVYPSTGR
jgi:hypothetical protein